MAERARHLMASLPLILSGSACLPLDDLSSYSNGLGAANGGSGSAPDTFADGGSEPSNVPDSKQNGSEEIPGSLPLLPGNGAADAGAGGSAGAVGGTASPPDAGGAVGAEPCALAFEFTSLDGSSCYRLSPDLAIWSGARAACQSWGGDLVSIESGAEDLFIAALAESAVWIGANDLEAEGVMVWPSGAPFVYTNWASTQPDDFMDQEDCVEMRSSGFWNDRLCEGNLLPYVCER